jgi:voltage-gated potassium channel Kch
LPFWLAFALPAELKILLVFRIIRFLKLARYSPGMRSLLDVLYAERRALFGCLVILIGATLLAATAMHVVERHVQPEKFGTIRDAMWWAIVTLGTIGYGDVVPVTPLGRVIAAATIFAGLIMVALPVGIVATAFANEIHRRDFVVTWGMVARVPLFSELNAAEIADIMRLLRAQQVEAGEVPARRGAGTPFRAWLGPRRRRGGLRTSRIATGSSAALADWCASHVDAPALCQIARYPACRPPYIPAGTPLRTISGTETPVHADIIALGDFKPGTAVNGIIVGGVFTKRIFDFKSSDQDPLRFFS